MPSSSKFVEKFSHPFLGLFLVIISSVFSGCITRTEVENYTITHIDTTREIISTMAPDRQDRGIIYPSSQRVEIHRRIVQYDSIVEHYYPDFIRLGVFESAGLIGTSKPEQGSMSSGLFGLFGLPDEDTAGIFEGGLYRFGIGEWRLRWFRDAKNWTIGTYAVELFQPAILENSNDLLWGVFPLYLRKRYFLREQIPYIALTPTVGIGVFPSLYLNIGGSLDVGSIGGLNLRAYAGYWLGYSAGENVAIFNRERAKYIATPYLGLGISFLDFLNRVEETYVEWKDHPHSAWNIGAMQIGFIYRGTDSLGKLNVPGFSLTLFPVTLAVPVAPQFYSVSFGTALWKIVVLDKDAGAFVFLPLRFGYWMTLIPDELSFSPFLEYGPYPSSYVDIGFSLNLYITEYVNSRLQFGFMQGKIIRNDLSLPNLTKFNNFSRWYIALQFGIGDRIFFDHQLRYARK